MNVLFVCTGNTCRSPFAEAVARHDGHIDVESAGLSASVGDRPPEDAIAVARELGFDLSSHRARPLTEDMLERAEVVVGMEADHLSHPDLLGAQGKTRLLGDVDIRDPFDCGPEQYRRAYAQIERDVRTLLEEHP